MIVKYIGRTTDFEGKTLWEILGNLKNFGVGRLVKRTMMDRYEEPCFFKILKVETLSIEENKDRKVRAYVEKIFRGKRYPNVNEIESVSYKPDFKLVPKSEEQLLWDRVAETKRVERIIPNRVPFPPLLGYILREEATSDDEKSKLQSGLKLIIKRGVDNIYRTCEDGESPTAELNKTKHPELYSDL